MSDLTAERLREILSYDPKTGTFVWLGGKWQPVGRVAGCTKRCVNKYYVTIKIDQRCYLAHHLAWLYVTGSWPNPQIDHRDLDSTNNRFSNLRESTQSQNMANTRKRPNRSGFKGVSPSPYGRWRAEIKTEGRYRYLGSFDTPRAAHRAYCAAAKEAFGEFARFA